MWLPADLPVGGRLDLDERGNVSCGAALAAGAGRSQYVEVAPAGGVLLWTMTAAAPTAKRRTRRLALKARDKADVHRT